MTPVSHLETETFDASFQLDAEPEKKFEETNGNYSINVLTQTQLCCNVHPYLKKYFPILTHSKQKDVRLKP